MDDGLLLTSCAVVVFGIIVGAVSLFVTAACALILVEQGDRNMAHLDRITSEVAEIKDAAESAERLLDEIAAKLREFADDPAAIAALADELDGAGNALAAAVARNTPGEAPPA